MAEKVFTARGLTKVYTSGEVEVRSARFVRAYLLIQTAAGLRAFLRLRENVRDRFFTDAAGARFIDDPAKIIHRQFRV
jgi:hypothetical protein